MSTGRVNWHLTSSPALYYNVAASPSTKHIRLIHVAMLRYYITIHIKFQKQSIGLVLPASCSPCSRDFPCSLVERHSNHGSSHAKQGGETNRPRPIGRRSRWLPSERKVKGVVLTWGSYYEHRVPCLYLVFPQISMALSIVHVIHTSAGRREQQPCFEDHHSSS